MRRSMSILRGLAILSFAALLPAVALAEKTPQSPPINPRDAAGSRPGIDPAPPGAQDLAGPGKAAPGKSGEAPGKAGEAPGKSGEAPGKAGEDPGKSGDAGKAGEEPGKAGEAQGNKPDEATKEARKKARKEAQAKSTPAEKAALRGKVSSALKGQPMSRAMKEELERHARRLARLQRVRDVAEDEADTATAERVNKLVAKENARHERWMSNYDAKSGESKGEAK